MARSDFDSAWKEALDAYFPQCLALLWPDLYARIDWQHRPAFLDKELQALLRSRQRGRRHVDKLAAVRLRNGTHALMLLHVEVQAGYDTDFTRRMFAYHVRLAEKYPHTPIVSLAMLADQPPRQTDSLDYHYAYCGCQLLFRFPVAYLQAWQARRHILQHMTPHNPFAVVLLAQLDATITRQPRQRLARKTELVRRLYGSGLNRDNIVTLFRIIDAMVGLPDALEPAFEDAVIQIEEETHMTYVTSIERLRLRREREQGMQQGQRYKAIALLTAQLTRKFGPLPEWAHRQLHQADLTTLDDWALRVLDAQRLEDVFS